MKDEKNECLKYTRCRFSLPLPEEDSIGCIVDGWEEGKGKKVSPSYCETCKKFSSRYIEYPLTIQGIDNQDINFTGLYETGSLCAVKPCGEDYGGKTFLGIYLGDLPVRIISIYNETNGMLTNNAMNNPAVFVPELKKIIFGMESWWRIIEKEEDLKDITDKEIEDTWYVRLLKKNMNKEGEK